MSTIQSAPAVVVGVDGSRTAIHAALWAVDEAVSRDIPLRLVYVIDPLQASGDGSHDGRHSIARAALYDAYRAVDATGKPVKMETDVLSGQAAHQADAGVEVGGDDLCRFDRAQPRLPR